MAVVDVCTVFFGRDLLVASGVVAIENARHGHCCRCPRCGLARALLALCQALGIARLSCVYCNDDGLFLDGVKADVKTLFVAL